MSENKEDTRYPYTYACDFVRTLGGYNKHGIKISRSDASEIISGIAKVIGMEDRKLYELLADAETSKSEEDRKREIKPFLDIIRSGGLNG
jgi:tRNA(Ile2) C34 agmatinyltransferase TiaS